MLRLRALAEGLVLQIFDNSHSHVVAELLVGHVRGVNPQGVEAGPNALEVFRLKPKAEPRYSFGSRTSSEL